MPAKGEIARAGNYRPPARDLAQIFPGGSTSGETPKRQGSPVSPPGPFEYGPPYCPSSQAARFLPCNFITSRSLRTLVAAGGFMTGSSSHSPQGGSRAETTASGRRRDRAWKGKSQPARAALANSSERSSHLKCWSNAKHDAGNVGRTGRQGGATNTALAKSLAARQSALVLQFGARRELED